MELWCSVPDALHVVRTVVGCCSLYHHRDESLAVANVLAVVVVDEAMRLSTWLEVHVVPEQHRYAELMSETTEEVEVVLTAEVRACSLML